MCVCDKSFDSIAIQLRLSFYKFLRYSKCIRVEGYLHEKEVFQVAIEMESNLLHNMTVLSSAFDVHDVLKHMI